MYIHTYICIYIYIYVCVCIHIRMYVCLLASIHLFSVFSFLCIYYCCSYPRGACVCVYIYIYICRVGPWGVSFSRMFPLFLACVVLFLSVRVLCVRVFCFCVCLVLCVVSPRLPAAPGWGCLGVLGGGLGSPRWFPF